MTRQLPAQPDLDHLGAARFRERVAQGLGDYVGVVEALLQAGAKAPRLTDEVEASEPVLEVLRRRAEPE